MKAEEISRLAFDLPHVPASALELTTGGVHVVVAENSRGARMLSWSALGAALRAVRSAALICEADLPVQDSAGGEEGRALYEAVKGDQLTVLGWSSVAREASTIELSQINDELLYYLNGVPRLLVLEGRLIVQLLRSNTLRAWRRWIEDCGTALLLVPRMEGGVPPELVREAGQLAGFARLEDNGIVRRLHVFHWFSSAGLATEKSYDLSGTAPAVSAAIPVDTGPAADEDAVFVLRNALPANAVPPAGWRIVEDVEALRSELVGAVAAAVVLGFDRATALEQIAQTTFELRKHHGSRLRIIVRENGTRLRHSQESVLTAIGANIIVPAEVASTRLPSLVAMVRGQVFRRALPDNYESAVAQAMPPDASGYLAPNRFAAITEATLDRYRLLGLQNALVRLSLVSSLHPEEALRYCVSNRPGDLCTADDTSVYVWLFACRDTDVTLALERLFRLPVSELFTGELRFLSVETIRQSLADLASRAGTIPDLSEHLVASGDRTPPDKATVEKVRKEFRKMPAAAVRVALPLRSAE